jgi:large subunit ribosomal protein L9
MQLLLTKNVARLGLVGEVVNVSPGYARNFLLPRGLAAKPTPANIKRLEAERIKMKELEQQRVASLKALAERLKGVEVTVVEKANNDGVLYGSVTPARIAAELQKEGHPVPEEAVRLSEPIRRVDTYDVAIELHEDVRLSIKLWVSPEKSAEPAAEGEPDKTEKSG